MDNIIAIEGKIENGRITTELAQKEIMSAVMNKKVVIIKKLFSEDDILQIRKAVIDWGKINPPTVQDDFKGNYHSQKVKVSNIQKVPHVFHDYNFNDIEGLPNELRNKLFVLFESLRIYYNELTGYTTSLGVKDASAYFHPQLIQYPSGGGFFGRHSHNLYPQQVGFILSLSRYGIDYRGGGTCFVMNDEIVDLEGSQDIGDLCLFRFDVDHWVKQSPLDDKFSWDDENGRWVATLAYFNPFS
jgi:hypothetical protein